MNCLGIDYGRKRMGLSYGDDLGVAVPLDPIEVDISSDAWVKQLREIVVRKKIECIVVGYPYNMDGSIGSRAKEVDHFIGRVEQAFALRVFKVDERLSTYEVQDPKSKNKDKSGKTDSKAAAVILQDFLDHRIIE